MSNMGIPAEGFKAVGQKNLNDLSADALMVKDPIAVQRSTTVQEAIKIMTSKHLLNLPVVDNGNGLFSHTARSPAGLDRSRRGHRRLTARAGTDVSFRSHI